MKDPLYWVQQLDNADKHRLLLVVVSGAVMGGLGFALTMASEALLAGLIREQSIGQWAAELFTPLGMAGLAGQLAFGAMPLLIKPPHHQNTRQTA